MSQKFLKACEGKAAYRFKRTINGIDHDNIDELESPNIDELKEAAKKYHEEHASYKVRKSLYIGNSSRTTRRKNQQQHEVAKRTFVLHTFWNTKESTEEINNDNDDLLGDEIKDCNWNNEISTVLKNLKLDIKKEKIKRKGVYSRCGHHAKISSFLWNEDILLQVKSYIREHKWNVTPQILMIQINEVILPGLEFASSPTIHINTARNYLKKLGYYYEK
ncbi:1730_t:CDS:2, partial [Diversispora eburnea]